MLTSTKAGWHRESSTPLASLAIPPVPRLDRQITGSSNPSPGPATPKNTSPAIPVRKAPRFAPASFHEEEDGEDNVPLIIQLSKREEQEREERKKRVLAEEVVKARMRADAARTGAADKEYIHDNRQKFARPIYDTYNSSPSLRPVTGTTMHDLDMPDPATRKPSNLRSSTWNGDVPKQKTSSSTRLSPPAFSDSEGTKGQRRLSVLNPASDMGHIAPSSRLRATAVSPVIPTVSLPMQMQAHSVPVYPFQLQPMIPVSAPPFMQSRFMVPSSSILDSFALPPPPPIRAGIPVSRSAERLIPTTGSAYSAGNSTTAARRTTANPEDLRRLTEQMKRGWLHSEQQGRLPGTSTTSSSKRDGRLTHESKHVKGREQRSEAHRKIAVDPRMQSGKTVEQKRLSHMPSAFSLPPKQSPSRLVSR